MKNFVGVAIVCILLFIMPEILMADNNLLVEFNYKGEQYSIQGKKVKKGVYLFNEGAEKKITITTLDWPPYIGENICKQGWVQQFTIALLASQGYEITSTFYPWIRAVSAAERGEADILYPSYFIEPTAASDVFKGTTRVEHLALSEKFPGGTNRIYETHRRKRQVSREV